MEPPVESLLNGNLFFFILALLFCALFSFIETSVTALRLFQLKELTKGSPKYTSLFHLFEHSPNRILISILIASNFANVLAAVLSSRVMEGITKSLPISNKVGFLVGIFFTSTTILLTDLIPKNIATIHGSTMFKSTLWITNIVYKALSPFVTVLSKIADYATKLIGGSSTKGMVNSVAAEKEIQFMLSYINEKGLMERHKTAMLKSIFELGTTPIKEVMVPETSVISINVQSTQKETLDLFSKYQFTRLPVYEERLDNIIGMLHQKDFFQLLSKNEDRPLRDIVRPITFIPESSKVLTVLRDFREQRMHIAMVLNEFGSITGLVTLEDVIEEIVGEITDEYESIPEKVIALKTGGYLVDASVDLEELETLLAIEFETEHSLSLAGFLIEQIDRMPKTGEEIEYKNYNFKVQQATPKRIVQVLVTAVNLPADLELNS
ncbi:HlyC/CorC family transporter [Candidatus Dependentiae bacterium]|nr:HlyC/CorC family transporter [Candidatus Dependentiae bacterium]